MAYKGGTFSHLKEVPPDLSPADFTKVMYAIVGDTLRNGGEIWTFIASTPRGAIPVGMVTASISPAGNAMEPHVLWFPQASPRNRIECALKWIIDMKAKYALFLWCKERDWKFYDHLGKYGAVRCVGKYRNFPGGGDAFLFQGVT